VSQLLDHYAVLGLTPRASADEIQRAYRTLVRRYHPDQHQANALRELAAERLAQLNAAFEVLGDPERRAHYDAIRRAGGRDPLGSGTGPFSRIAPPRFLRPVIAILMIALFGLALHYLRNPRLLLYAALLTALIWGIAVVMRRRKRPPSDWRR